MIPKIVHYSWFSGEPYPAFLTECMNTWKKALPDYEFVLWDAQKLAEINNTFANEAVSVKKWAFAADFVRLYAVYHYGGIWLDTDVEMFKSFDPFLNDGMFIGREYYIWNTEGKEVRCLTSHCFGAEKHHPFIKECLEFYEHRHFIRSYNEKLPQTLRYDMTIIPRLQAYLALNNGYDWNAKKNGTQVLDNGIHVYPYQYFDQQGYTSMKEVVCIHRIAQSWNPKYDGCERKHWYTNVKKKNLRWYVRNIAKPIIRFLNRI